MIFNCIVLWVMVFNIGYRIYKDIQNKRKKLKKAS